MSDRTDPVLVVGSAALDSVATPDGCAEEEVGGSALYFAAAAALLAPVRVVAVVGQDFPWERIAFLGERGVDTSGVEVRAGKTFRWRGAYHADLEGRDTLATELNVFASFAPMVPPGYRGTPLLFLGNIDPELQADVRAQLAGVRLTALDTMNFWIAGRREALLKILARADVVLLNESEARELTGLQDLPAAARAVRSLGPSRVVVKRGPHGALLWDGARLFSCPAVRLEKVVDPTGAGDSFAGGFMGYLARCGTPGDEHFRQAMVYGAVMASFAVESFGLAGLAGASLGEVERRRRSLSAQAF